MKPAMIAGQIAGMLVCAGVGLAGGIWFMQHYAIVPREEMAPATPGSPVLAPPASPSLGAPALQPPSSPAVPATNDGGPFSYTFTPGEELDYSVTADIEGTGLTLGEGDPIDTTFTGLMKMATQSVDASGNGTLDIRFENAHLIGEFMGGPVEYHQTGTQASLSMDGRTQMDTARGDTIQGIPQMEFLAETIRTVVAPNGRVLDVSGPQGFDQMLSSSALVSPVQFNDSEIPVNHEWTTEFQLPIPGLETLIPAQAHNRLVGYQMINGRRCGVIEQQISALDSNGTINVPSSALGEAMGLTMPTFNLNGQNMVYFDIENGALVNSNMALGLQMELGQTFSPVASLLEAFSGLLSEVEGGAPAQLNTDEEQELTTLNLNIRANMSLVE